MKRTSLFLALVVALAACSEVPTGASVEAPTTPPPDTTQAPPPDTVPCDTTFITVVDSIPFPAGQLTATFALFDTTGAPLPVADTVPWPIAVPVVVVADVPGADITMVQFTTLNNGDQRVASGWLTVGDRHAIVLTANGPFTATFWAWGHDGFGGSGSSLRTVVVFGTGDAVGSPSFRTGTSK